MEKRVKAFTLAEVLITLSILGVVAAISIPNIIQQYQKRLTITKLQKAYAFLENAAQNIAVNSGCIGRDIACTGLYDITTNWGNTENFLLRFSELAKIKNYKIHRTLGTYAGNLGCKSYANCDTYPNVIFKQYITTSNGLLFHFMPVATYENVSVDRKAILVAIGTEKRKKPDDVKDETTYKLGKNMFLFTIYDNFIVEPVGWYGTSNTLTPLSKTSNANIAKLCNLNNTAQYSNGTSCAAKIIKDGWKITYQ